MDIYLSKEPKVLNHNESIITGDKQNFKENLNSSSFKFTHNLVQHSLFEIPRLVKLADFLLRQEGRSILFRGSDRPVDNFDDEQSRNKQRERLLQELADIEQSNSWLLLYSVQRDPEYRALLDQIISELEQLSGRELRSQITWLDAYIFMASPGGVTPYHIDHETTFLFQIAGERTSNLFDGRDRTILSDVEIEKYYIGDFKSAKYRKDKQTKANVYQLTPGTGVHHPSLAPHWYQNGDKYSVALGVHFCLKDTDRKSKIYQFNYYLRQLGLSPTSPGKSPLKDRLKAWVIEAISTRQPKTKYELLRSGVNRLKTVIKLFKSV